MNPTWKKSVRCGSNAGCVETARLASVIGVRDSTDRGGPALFFTPIEWAAFRAEVTGGRHGLR